MVLRFLFVALLAISQCHGYQDPERVKQVFTKILEEQLNEIKTSHGNIEDIFNQIEKEKEKSSQGVSLLKLDDAPAPCLNLVKTTAPCPDFTILATQAKTVLDEATGLVVHAVKTFNEAFRNPEYQCTATVNPITALRCFLRAFKVAYDNLSSMKGEVKALNDDVQKLYEEFKQYQNDCKDSDTHVQLKSEILDLCKKYHSR